METLPSVGRSCNVRTWAESSESSPTVEMSQKQVRFQKKLWEKRPSRYPPSLQRAGRVEMSRCLRGLGRFGGAAGRLLELGAVGEAV